jgi:hypothetical protein
MLAKPDNAFNGEINGSNWRGQHAKYDERH